MSLLLAPLTFTSFDLTREKGMYHTDERIDHLITDMSIAIDESIRNRGFLIEFTRFETMFNRFYLASDYAGANIVSRSDVVELVAKYDIFVKEETLFLYSMAVELFDRHIEHTDSLSAYDLDAYKRLNPQQKKALNQQRVQKIIRIFCDREYLAPVVFVKKFVTWFRLVNNKVKSSTEKKEQPKVEPIAVEEPSSTPIVSRPELSQFESETREQGQIQQHEVVEKCHIVRSTLKFELPNEDLGNSYLKSEFVFLEQDRIGPPTHALNLSGSAPKKLRYAPRDNFVYHKRNKQRFVSEMSFSELSDMYDKVQGKKAPPLDTNDGHKKLSSLPIKSEKDPPV